MYMYILPVTQFLNFFLRRDIQRFSILSSEYTYFVGFYQCLYIVSGVRPTQDERDTRSTVAYNI